MTPAAGLATLIGIVAILLRTRGVRRALAAMAVAGLVVTSGVATAQVEPPLDDPTTPTSSTTTTTIDPADDHAADETGAPEAPPEDVEVPEPEPAPEAPAFDPRLRTAVVAERAGALQRLLDAEVELGANRQELRAMVDEEQRLARQLVRTRTRERDANRRFGDARSVLAGRAASVYVNGPGELSFILDAGDPNELLHRVALAQSVLESDRDELAVAAEAQSRAAGEVDALTERLAALATEQRALRTEVAVLEMSTMRQRAVLEMFNAGATIGIAGFVFPVGDPHAFGDSFGAPRMTGTQYEHWHQGTDIFAPFGTELFAVERGVVSRVGSDVLGGTKLWLVGASGARYYYAHLSRYGDGIAEGSVVEAGDVVGYVGNTGNAATTPPHLHFEIHPRGFPGAVNPYPILAIADRFRHRPPPEEGEEPYRPGASS